MTPEIQQLINSGKIRPVSQQAVPSDVRAKLGTPINPNEIPEDVRAHFSSNTNVQQPAPMRTDLPPRVAEADSKMSEYLTRTAPPDTGATDSYLQNVVQGIIRGTKETANNFGTFVNELRPGDEGFVNDPRFQYGTDSRQMLMDRWAADPNQKGERLGKFVGENIPGLVVGAGAGALAARGGLAAANALGTTGTLGKVAGAIESPLGRYATRTLGETVATTPFMSGSDNKPVSAGDFAGNFALNAILDPTAYKAGRNTSFGKAIGGFKGSPKENSFFDETASTIYNRTRPVQEAKMDKQLASSMKSIISKGGVKSAGKSADFLTGDWMGEADVIPNHLTPEEYGLVQFSREVFTDNSGAGIKFIARPTEGDIIMDTSNTVRALTNRTQAIGEQQRKLIGELSKAPTHSQDEITDFGNIKSFIDNFNSNKKTSTYDLPAAAVYDKMKDLVNRFKIDTRTSQFGTQDFQQFGLKELFDMKGYVDSLDGASDLTKKGMIKFIDNLMLQSAEMSGGPEAKASLQALLREYGKVKDFTAIADSLKEKIVTRDMLTELGGILTGSVTGSLPVGVLTGLGARVGNNKSKAKAYSSLFGDKSTGFTKAYRKDVANQASAKAASAAEKVNIAKQNVEKNAPKLEKTAEDKAFNDRNKKLNESLAEQEARNKSDVVRQQELKQKQELRDRAEKIRMQEAKAKRAEKAKLDAQKEKQRIAAEKLKQKNKLELEREKAKLATARDRAKAAEKLRLEQEKQKNREMLKEAMNRNTKKSTPR